MKYILHTLFTCMQRHKRVFGLLYMTAKVSELYLQNYNKIKVNVCQTTLFKLFCRNEFVSYTAATKKTTLSFINDKVVFL